MNRAVVGLALVIGACMEAGQDGGPGGESGEEPASSLLPEQPDLYEGQWMCRTLMQTSGVEPLSRCPTGPGDPGDLKLPGRAGCLRDSYVFTAIAYCWRSECLARQGVSEADVLAGRASTSPDRESRLARKMLENASSLCTAPDAPADTCTTSSIVACPS
jgi:hypothetical protein